MADAPHNVDGLAMVEAEIRLPTTNQLVPVFTAENIFHSATITENATGFSEWMLNCQTTNRNFVDTLVRNSTAGGTPHIRLRYGFGTAGGSISWNAWTEYLIRSDVSKIVGLGGGAGYMATLSCVDRLSEIQRISKTVPRKGKISDIVKTIADSYGLPAVIEPTKYEGLWIQSFVNDYDFILFRMMPRAINDKGRGNYKFFLKDEVLHFHTPDYQTDLKEFNYHASSGVSLRHVDATQNRLSAGSAGTRMIIHDPYSGIHQELESNASLALRLGNTLPDVDSIPGLKKNIFYHLSANRLPEAVAIGQSTYENARFGDYHLELEIQKSIFFRVGDIVNTLISPKDSETTPTSGLYYVQQVRHEIKTTDITSFVRLERGEYFVSQSPQPKLVQQAQNVVSAPNSAPGQSLNLGDAASSVTTKGAGKESSRRNFRDAQNPNTAPS